MFRSFCVVLILISYKHVAVAAIAAIDLFPPGSIGTRDASNLSQFVTTWWQVWAHLLKAGSVES